MTHIPKSTYVLKYLLQNYICCSKTAAIHPNDQSWRSCNVPPAYFPRHPALLDLHKPALIAHRVSCAPPHPITDHSLTFQKSAQLQKRLAHVSEKQPSFSQMLEKLFFLDLVFLHTHKCKNKCV